MAQASTPTASSGGFPDAHGVSYDLPDQFASPQSAGGHWRAYEHWRAFEGRNKRIVRLRFRESIDPPADRRSRRGLASLRRAGFVLDMRREWAGPNIKPSTCKPGQLGSISPVFPTRDRCAGTGFSGFFSARERSDYLWGASTAAAAAEGAPV